MKRLVCLLILIAHSALAADLEPGKPVDYKSLAFYPERWEDRKVDTQLIPWQGQHIVLLTDNRKLNAKTMTRIVERLDGGWQLYAKLVGQEPSLFKHLDSKPLIAAIPDGNLSCGVGCGYIGATGIEVGKFYDDDYPLMLKNENAFPHYFYYEMGRNYYVFGDRHSSFITGYAVFMRYVCMDTLECEDPDAATRKTIEACEAEYAKSDLSFLKAFTMADGLDEKAPRLSIHPSDQPVMYATAMLKLHRECGGNEWLTKFYRHLAKCPEIKPDTKEKALEQSLSWLVCASAAAGKDLTPVFVDRWRMPLTAAERKALVKVDWSNDKLEVQQVLREFPKYQ